MSRDSAAIAARTADCRALVGLNISRGRCGDVDLSGVKCVGIYDWPKAIHGGNGKVAFVVDPATTDKQVEALRQIFTGALGGMPWPYGLYHGHLAVGAGRSLKGDVELAMPALERALRIATESSMPAMGRPTVAHLGSVYGLIGRVEEATAVLEAGLGEAEGHRGNAFRPLNLCALAHVYLLGGQIVETEQAATRALELSRRQEGAGK